MGRVTSKGQVTIPIELREEFGIQPGSIVRYRRAKTGVLVELAPPKDQERGRRLVERMRGKASIGLTTDEIMALTRGED